MFDHLTSRSHGLGNVLLDATIAWLLPSFATRLLRLTLPDGPALVGASLACLLLVFHLIGKLRGRPGLPFHLAKVCGFMAVLSLALNRFEFTTDWFLSLPVLAACAALGGWTGSRQRD